MKKVVILFSMISVIIIALLCFFIFKLFQTQKTIRVGILHSLTGTMAISEKEVVNATLLAIEEINNKGGLLGKKIEPIVVDGKSDWPTFATEAENLITKQGVAVTFGCWTSASRKTVKPVIEKYKHLLFYPVQYEGLESSPNIIYTGAAPNQQVIPGVSWCFNNLGKSFFLVGSNYVFPRVANEIIKDLASFLGAQIVGEEYILLGSKEVGHIIQKIVETKPAVIINTINGDSNIPFFQELRKAGITPEKIPTISFSIAEPELKHLDIQTMVGDYAAWNYFQSIYNPSNTHFITQFKSKYGKDAVVSDPMEAAYFGVQLWAKTVNEIGTVDSEQVTFHLKNKSNNAPEGVINIDSTNQHTWKFVRVGKIQSKGQFNIVWDSEKSIQPTPYPTQFRSIDEWNNFLDTLYKGWGNQWSAK